MARPPMVAAGCAMVLATIMGCVAPPATMTGRVAAARRLDAWTQHTMPQMQKKMNKGTHT